jgi:hypothetical protein
MQCKSITGWLINSKTANTHTRKSDQVNLIPTDAAAQDFGAKKSLSTAHYVMQIYNSLLTCMQFNPQVNYGLL